MTHAMTRMVAVAMLAVLGLTVLTGCNQKVKAEREALYAQNKEYEDLLAQLRAENERLRAQPAPAPPPMQPAAANTGFSDIADVDVIQGNGMVTVRIPGDVLFASGKADLKSASKTTLKKIANVLETDYSGQTIRVEGYTDSDPIKKSKWKDNMELSIARASAVQSYLQQQGVPAGQMQVVGFGAAKPQATKAKSRRVEIVVVQN